MNNIILALALLSLPIAKTLRAANDSDIGQRVQQLEDKVALKSLVDTFSNLADQKDIPKQILLFTEDATVESYSDGKQSSSLKGREQIGQTFGAFLGGFETVYHINGQQTVQLHGDNATDVSYCLVVLIGKQDDKTFMNTSGVYYNDEYVRRGNTWLISKRTSHFTWRDRKEMPQQSR